MSQSWRISTKNVQTYGNEPYYVMVGAHDFSVYGVSPGTEEMAGYYIVNGKKYVDSITITVEE